jgi:hypothetical protein
MGNLYLKHQYKKQDIQHELIIFYHFPKINYSSPLTYITIHIDLFA